MESEFRIRWATVKKHLTEDTTKKKDYIHGIEVILDEDNVGEEPESVENVSIITPIGGLKDIHGFYSFPPIDSQVLVALVDGRWVMFGSVFHPQEDAKPDLDTSRMKFGNGILEVIDDGTVNITMLEDKTLTITVSGGGTIDLVSAGTINITGGTVNIGDNNAVALAKGTHTHALPAHTHTLVTPGVGSSGPSTVATVAAGSDNTTKCKGT